MDGHKNMDSSGVEPKVDLLQWNVSETGTFIKELFSEEISRKFEGKETCVCPGVCTCGHACVCMTY